MVETIVTVLLTGAALTFGVILVFVIIARWCNVFEARSQRQPWFRPEVAGAFLAIAVCGAIAWPVFWWKVGKDLIWDPYVVPAWRRRNLTPATWPGTLPESDSP